MIALWIVTGVSACGGGEDDFGWPEENAAEVSVVRELRLSGPPAETSEPMFGESSSATLYELLERLDVVRRDSHVRGLFLRAEPFGGAWARAAEVAAALQRIRQAGKPIHCHFDVIDNSGYALLARSCDRITMSPAGDLDLVGVAAHVFYARQLLDAIGIRAELLQIGRYKGAADTFTLEDMPEEVRQSLDLLLDDLYGRLVDAVATGRRLSPEAVRTVVNQGPFDAGAARAAGLIDHIAFDDEAAEHARVAAHADRVWPMDPGPRTDAGGLGELIAALGGERPTVPIEGRHIALVELDGTITDGDEHGPDPSRAGPFVRTFRRMARDENIAAIVLRIDSPGGSALASDRMWHAVRRTALRKPVIVSIGDMAASGGYYIASAATVIVAQPESLVGSIGVVGGKITFADLAERIGVHTVVLRRGQNAAWTSPVQGFTDDERADLEHMLQSTYDRFIARIAEGRSLDPAVIAPAAEGRIMTGQRAHTAQLVNETGGLWHALALARRRAGLPEDAPVEVWPERQTLADALAAAFGHERDRDADSWLVPIASTLGLRPSDLAAWHLLLSSDRIAVRLPFALRIE